MTQPLPFPPTVEGVDLSVANGSPDRIDFDRVRNAGKRFLVSRANHGESKRDPTFLEHGRRARNAGLLFTAYHFFEADEDPRDDVAAFVEATRPADLDLPIWLDVETLNARSEQQFAESLDGWIQEYLAISGARRLGFYTSLGFWTPLKVLGRDPKWAHVADLISAAYGPSKPPVFDPWTKALFHQYKGNTIWKLPPDAPKGTKTWGARMPWPGSTKIVSGGLCDGIEGECDLDKFYGTYEDLLALGARAGVGPTATTWPAPQSIAEAIEAMGEEMVRGFEAGIADHEKLPESVRQSLLGKTDKKSLEKAIEAAIGKEEKGRGT